MSHFYGVLQGSRGQATRCATKKSGLTAIAASWDGAVETTLFEREGKNYYRVERIPWHGNGERVLLAEGAFE